jgi:hypothetical protein
VGSIVTSEVPGLAEALRRPGINAHVEMRPTSGEALSTAVMLPDAVATLTLKTLVRSLRTETRDAEDLWRSLEIAAADGIAPGAFDENELLQTVRTKLSHELGPNGAALSALTAGMQHHAAARRRTRLRALLTETVGPARSAP